MAVPLATKQQQSKDKQNLISEPLKCQRIILHLNSGQNVFSLLKDLLPKVPREFELRYELAKPDPLREIKSLSTSSIVLYTP